MDTALRVRGRGWWLSALATFALCILGACNSQDPGKPSGKAAPARTPRPDGSPAATKEVRTVKVGTEAAYPPMEFVEDNVIVGYDVDLIKAVAEAGGFKVEIQNIGWDALFGSLANKDLDVAISSVTITEERKKTMVFSDPYYKSGQRLIVHAKHKDKNLTLETMDGMNVGAQIATTSSELVEKQFPKVKLRTYDNVVFGLTDLDGGNLDGFVVDDPVGRYYASKSKYKNLVFVEKDYTSEEFGIVIRKGDDELVKMINEGLRKIKESGVADQLKDKWLR